MGWRMTDRDWQVVRWVLWYVHHTPKMDIVMELFPDADGDYRDQKVEQLGIGVIHFFNALDDSRQRQLIQMAADKYSKELG